MVYTPAARSAAGGRQKIENLISLGVTETNTAFTNSGIQTRVRLVHRAEIQYTESSERIGLDLQRLQGPADGFMDSVHALRNQHKADLVMLVGNSTANGCGVTYVMSTIGPGFEVAAFSYVARQCISPTYAFGHELAHNLGSDHAPDDPIGPAAYPYSYGYKDPLFRFRTMDGLPLHAVVQSDPPLLESADFLQRLAHRDRAAEQRAVDQQRAADRSELPR